MSDQALLINSATVSTNPGLLPNHLADLKTDESNRRTQAT